MLLIFLLFIQSGQLNHYRKDFFMNIFDELKARGLVFQTTDEAALSKALTEVVLPTPITTTVTILSE